MVNIIITVDNISKVLTLFNKIQLMRYSGTGTPPADIDLDNYVDIVGIDKINDRNDVSDIILSSEYSQYYFTDPEGNTEDWYISRYIDDVNDTTSGWSNPTQYGAGDMFYNPLYPPEAGYNTSDRLVIDRIRLYIGDPVELNRQHGPEAANYLHNDNMVYELEEKGWPCSINMYGTQYNSIGNPYVNGYKYLKFKDAIDPTPTTVSGIEYSIDVWYYTFRFSDKQIIDAYDSCFTPAPLNESNCTPEIYMLQTAYDLLSNETWEVISEDGAKIVDADTSYSPEPGLNSRDKMLKRLKDRLDKAVKSLQLQGISGVRID